LVAEALARMGRRTLVLAPTHQAINNALSTIRRCFPGRRTVKIGDELRRESLDEGVDCTLFVDGTRRSGIPVSSDTITGMTFVSALHHLILRKSALAPNVVLIEEAGQLPLAHGICAGLIGAGSILMFGDDLQMPPVFPAAVADDPLAESLFARFRRVSLTPSRGCRQPTVSTPISAMSSEASSIRQPFTQAPMLVIDASTSTLLPMRLPPPWLRPCHLKRRSSGSAPVEGIRNRQTLRRHGLSPKRFARASWRAYRPTQLPLLHRSVAKQR